MRQTKSKIRFSNLCIPCGNRMGASNRSQPIHYQVRLRMMLLLVVLAGSGFSLGSQPEQRSLTAGTIKPDPRSNLGQWEGWGSSLAWWARAIGGTANADYYADLIYTTKITDGYAGP